MTEMMIDRITRLGGFVLTSIAGIGHASIMFFTVIRRSLGIFKRFRLVSDQVFFLGNYSFVIIAVSGLFVGFVLINYFNCSSILRV